jgi:4'-phosphopantetheinyl transferase
MEIIAVKIPREVSAQEQQILKRLLTRAEVTLAARLARPVDALRRLVATSFLRMTLGTRVQLPGQRIPLRRGPHGKPFIAARHRLQFNLSHAGDYLVLAFDERELGIDIEQIKQRDMDGISYFFSPRELAAYQNCTSDEKIGFFFDLWTAKESFIKAVGKGFALDLARFTICFGDTITVETELDPRQWHFRQYALDPGYKMTVCALSADFPSDVRLMAFHELVTSATRLVPSALTV